MDHKQIKQLKKQAQAEKRRLSKLMNNASPGADWCSTFIQAIEGDRVQGVSEAEQQTVRSWAARIEQLRSTASINKSLEKLPLTDADKQLRVEVQLVQAKFPKHALTLALKNTNSAPLAPAEPIKKAPASSTPKEKSNANSDSDEEDEMASLKPEGMSASEWKKLKRKARKKERQARKAEKKQKEKGDTAEGDDSKKEEAKEAKKAQLDEDRRGAKYSAAGLVAFAVRRRAVPKNAGSHQNAKPHEVVVLMVCEKRNKQVLNFPGGKVRMSEDHNDSNLTALREFSEETKLIWEYDAAAMEQRMRADSPDMGLVRCFQQDGGYFLHFAQIPYIPNANKLLAEKKSVKLTAGGGELAPDHTTGLFWVPLKTILCAAKLKSIEVTVHPGTTPPVFRRISLHKFVAELCRNRKIADNLKLLNSLFVQGKIHPLPMPDFAQPDQPDELEPQQHEEDDDAAGDDAGDNASGSEIESDNESDAEEPGNDKKRKRDEMETDADSGPRDVFGPLSSNKLDLDGMDWDAIVGNVIESRTGGKASLTAKGPLKKIVLQDLSKQVRSRLVAMLDAQLSKRTQYLIENGQIGPRPKKQKLEEESTK